MAKNILTGQPVAGSFLHPTPPPRIETISITSMDPPYFAIRAQTASSIDTLLTDPPIKDKSYKEIPMRCFGLEKDKLSDRDRDEIAFLNRLCLVVQRDKKYFISEKAIQLFYGSTGLFMQKPPADMTPIAAFFLTYVLPGQYWRRYYAVYPLPETISARRQLDANLTDIEREWSSLRTHFS